MPNSKRAFFVDFSKNFFELFELEPQFSLDVEALKPLYRQLQKELHPDKFVNASDSEKLLSLRWTSFVNEALEVLSSPLKRAIYLMSLWGREVDLEQNAVMSPEFLMEQMALREALDEIEQAADPESVIDKFLQDTRQAKNSLITDLSMVLAGKDSADLAEAEEQVRRLAFFVKLEEQARKLEDKLLD